MSAVSSVTHSSNEQPLKKLFNSSTKYEIPLYQRSFKWNKSQLDQVEIDFDEILSGEKSLHFFGATIFHVDGDRVPGKTETYEIIDGQQRITTIFLFYLAFVYVLRKCAPDRAELYFTENLIDIWAEKSNSRLIPGKEDRGQLNWIFAQIVRNSEFEDSLKFKYLPFPEDGETRSTGLLRNCYSKFRKYFEDKIEDLKSNQEKKEKLEEIFTEITLSCTMVSINIREKQNGPLIFDALNSRQEKITVGELIKNALFARNKDLSISQMQHIHDAEWFPFVNRFQMGKLNLLENYFFPYGLINNINLKKNNVYKDIVTSWGKTKKVSDIVFDLKEYQDAFMALNGDINKDIYPKNLIVSVKKIVEGGLPKSCLSFFMQVLRAVEKNPNYEKEAINIFNTLEAFLVRRAVCSTDPAGLHAVFKRMWHDLSKIGEINSSTVMNYIKDPKHDTVKWISDEDFQEGIKTTSLYSKKICRFLLIEYDRSLGGEVPTDEDITIEHVLPQTSNKSWSDKFTTEEHIKNVNVFANLVLLTGTSNSSGSNKSYLEKKEQFSDNAKFKSTREFFKRFDDWDITNLESRSNELVDWALKRWKY